MVQRIKPSTRGRMEPTTSRWWGMCSTRLPQPMPKKVELSFIRGRTSGTSLGGSEEKGEEEHWGASWSSVPSSNLGPQLSFCSFRFKVLAHGCTNKYLRPGHCEAQIWVIEKNCRTLRFCLKTQFLPWENSYCKVETKKGDKMGSLQGHIPTSLKFRVTENFCRSIEIDSSKILSHFTIWRWADL